VATELLLTGIVTPIIQNTIYALPSLRTRIFCETTTAVIQQSNLVAFTTAAAVTLTDGMADLAGGFIRCTSGNVNIKLVRT
jgi:hypothetical protein